MDIVTPQELERATGGRYEVLSLIGTGGMGAVYLGVHRELGSKVAIKILPSDLNQYPALLSRFKREASVAAQSSHPNLVPVFQLETAGVIPYLVMPYIEGHTLEQLLKERGPLPEKDVLKLATDIGSALAYVHERGFVHRDVKPANILWEGATRRWLLTDFGIAHVTAVAGDLTRSGDAIGTLRYMAPEQLAGAKHVDGRADLYSLACVLYESLTGTPPDILGSERASHDLHRVRTDVSPSTSKILTSPLATDRDERPASVEAWLAQLDSVTQRQPIPIRIVAVTVLSLALVAGLLTVRMRDGENAATEATIAVTPFTITGRSPGLDLNADLPRAVAFQVKALSGLEVLEPQAVHASIVRQLGPGHYPLEQLLSVVQDRHNAKYTLAGNGWVRDGKIWLRIELFEGSTRIRADDDTTSLDSLYALVPELIKNTVGVTVAQQQTGTVNPALPEDYDALVAYLDGERAFRRGDFDSTVAQFDRVIELEPMFGPVRLLRMLAGVLRLRPTQLGLAIDQDLNVAAQRRTYLDDVSGELFEAQKSLLQDGDLQGAVQILGNTVDKNQDAIYASFLLGLLQLRFPSLIGSSLGEARATLGQVLIRDPTFAAAHALSFAIAINDDDQVAAQRHLRTFLSMDSSSVRAELLKLGDSLFFMPREFISLTRSFPSRPVEILEYIALAAGELDPPGGGRPIGLSALGILASRAFTATERAVTFRMRLAAALGSGRAEHARDLLSRAAVTGVPSDEIDRWHLLSRVTSIPDLGTESQANAAAGRLLSDEREPAVSAWLVARWTRGRGQTQPYAMQRLDSLAQSQGAQALLARSFLEDLQAQDSLARGSAESARELLRRATSRYSIQDVPFGSVGALWPLQLELINVAQMLNDHATVIEVSRRFDRMAGFVDQVAWSDVLMARADAALSLRANAVLSLRDQENAIDGLNALVRALRNADGLGANTRDSASAILERLQPR